MRVCGAGLTLPAFMLIVARNLPHQSLVTITTKIPEEELSAMKINIGLIVGFLLFSSGCSFMDAQHRYEPGTPFGSYKSFQWVPAQEKTAEVDNSSEIDPKLDELIRGKISQELKNKNFTESLMGNADFLINYRFIVRERTAMNKKTESFLYQNYRYANSIDVETYSYRTGSLILDVIDPTSQEVVWQGDVSGFLDLQTDPKKQDKRLEKAVHMLLASFPPKE